MKKNYGKKRFFCAVLIAIMLVLPTFCAVSEEVAPVHGFGADVIDEGNAIEYNGKTYEFDANGFYFNGAVDMVGGNTRSLYEYEVPQGKIDILGANEKVYLGTVLIMPPAKMDLFVFSGDRDSGKYTLMDQQTTSTCMMDIFAVRDEAGTLRLIDTLFLFSYQKGGEEVLCAASLYISYEGYEAALAEGAPATAEENDAVDDKEYQKLKAELERYIGIVQKLEEEKKELEKQLSEKETEIAELRAENENEIAGLHSEMEAELKAVSAQNEVEIAELRSQNEDLVHALEAQLSENANISSNIEDLERKISELQEDNAELKKALEEKSAELEKMSGTACEVEVVSLSDGELSDLLSRIQTEINARMPKVPASPVTDFKYASNGTEVRINSYAGSDRDIVIPDMIDGLPVTLIGSQAFMNMDDEKINSVKLPSALREIGDFAFAWQENLSGILEIPASVEKIGQSAFMSTGYTGIVINSSVDVEENGALAPVFAEFLFIRDGANPRFSSGSFDICFMLNTAVIPASVTFLPDNLFVNSSELTIFTPAGSAAEAWAKENFVPVNTDLYDEYYAEYDALYPLK